MPTFSDQRAGYVSNSFANKIDLLMRNFCALLTAFTCLLSIGCSTRFLNVQGNAMAPAVNDGDLIVTGSIDGPIRRGDIVVFEDPRDRAKICLLRVVGLPGDRIDELYQSRAVANGSTRLVLPVRQAANPEVITIPEDAYYVLGDNPEHSYDSRSFGPIKRSTILSRLIRVLRAKQ
jgi:signal peptidase I